MEDLLKETRGTVFHIIQPGTVASQNKADNGWNAY